MIDPQTSELSTTSPRSTPSCASTRVWRVEQAREIIHDVSYFGTMLVHNDMVDGMVSGARAHHRAHRAALVRDHQDVAGRVDSVQHFPDVPVGPGLAYGDCAIVPDPTSEQLADIAVSSATYRSQVRHSAARRHAVVLDRYSGTGVEVDKVRTATELVRQREPELLVDGPIQYDAAVEPSVAKTKMPDSEVAGRATVLIFPDLNTGNNTYKTVQRSAGAIAIGPVLQGLKKPVNDFSRGALVEDIVNTVAITAIQAQTL